MLLKSGDRHRADQEAQEEFVKEQSRSPGNLVDEQDGAAESQDERGRQEQELSDERRRDDHEDEDNGEGDQLKNVQQQAGECRQQMATDDINDQNLPKGIESGGGDLEVNSADSREKVDEREEGEIIIEAVEEPRSSDEVKVSFGRMNSHDEEQPLKEVKGKDKKKPSKHKTGVEESDTSATSRTWRDEFDDDLDDDLIGDEEDRRYLEALTEKEREEEIFKRSERREEMKRRFEISQKLREQQMRLEAGLSSPRSRSPGERRKKSQDEKKNTALSALKAKREEREEKEKIRKEQFGVGKKLLSVSEIYSSSSDAEGGRRRSSSSSSSSSSSYHSSSSGESDTERHSSKKVVKKSQVLESIHDLERIRLSRWRLDKFVHLPIFRKTVVGCFVRIGIGNNPENNKPIYRVAEVVDVCETSKVYDVMKGQARTNVGLKLKHGKDSRVFRLQFVSNSHFEETEFLKWKETCAAQDVPLPTLSKVEEKVKAIGSAANFQFNDLEVDKVIASKGRFSKEPKKFALQKTRLQRERGVALECGDQERAHELEDQIKELDFKSEEIGRHREGNLAIVQQINSRNRRDNLARAERSIVAEASALALKGPGVLDPFTRRKTLPSMNQAVERVKKEKCLVLGEEDVLLPEGAQVYDNSPTRV